MNELRIFIEDILEGRPVDSKRLEHIKGIKTEKFFYPRDSKEIEMTLRASLELRPLEKAPHIFISEDDEDPIVLILENAISGFVSGYIYSADYQKVDLSCVEDYRGFHRRLALNDATEIYQAWEAGSLNETSEFKKTCDYVIESEIPFDPTNLVKYGTGRVKTTVYSIGAPSHRHSTRTVGVELDVEHPDVRVFAKINILDSTSTRSTRSIGNLLETEYIDHNTTKIEIHVFSKHWTSADDLSEELILDILDLLGLFDDRYVALFNRKNTDKSRFSQIIHAEMQKRMASTVVPAENDPVMSQEDEPEPSPIQDEIYDQHQSSFSISPIQAAVLSAIATGFVFWLIS